MGVFLFVLYLYHMKYLIIESKVREIALKWMDDNFSLNQLDIIKNIPEYPTSIFYKKNGKVFMEQQLDSKYFWFDYDEIWSFFKQFLGMTGSEIKTVLKIWLKKTLKLEKYTPWVVGNSVINPSDRRPTSWKRLSK